MKLSLISWTHRLTSQPLDQTVTFRIFPMRPGGLQLRSRRSAHTAVLSLALSYIERGEQDVSLRYMFLHIKIFADITETNGRGRAGNSALY